MALWVRAKMGDHTIDDVQVALALKHYVSPNLLPDVFKALEKSKTLQEYAVALKGSR
ncbi:hypothetical protein PHMEG_00037793, partial [Phytophthora megakarya]